MSLKLQVSCLRERLRIEVQKREECEKQLQALQNNSAVEGAGKDNDREKEKEKEPIKNAPHKRYDDRQKGDPQTQENRPSAEAFSNEDWHLCLKVLNVS